MNSRKFHGRVRPQWLLSVLRIFCAIGAAMLCGMDASRAASLAEMFARPLIIGASVSADTGALSPGKKLALRFTAPANVRTIAYGGRPGTWVLRGLSPNVLDGRTIVIGVDLFFWDSVSVIPARSERVLNDFMSEVAARGLPIVLGDIPALRPGLQWARSSLNGYIRQVCAAYWNCYLMPLEAIHQTASSSGLRTRYGVLSLDELLPDGLHVSDSASEYLADVMLSVIQRRNGRF